MVETEHTVAAVVTLAYADVLGVCGDEESVEGREAGRVGYGWAFENGAEDCFEAGCVWCGVSRVDMVFRCYS